MVLIICAILSLSCFYDVASACVGNICFLSYPISLKMDIFLLPSERFHVSDNFLAFFVILTRIFSHTLIE